MSNGEFPTVDSANLLSSELSNLYTKFLEAAFNGETYDIPLIYTPLSERRGNYEQCIKAANEFWQLVQMMSVHKQIVINSENKE